MGKFGDFIYSTMSKRDKVERCQQIIRDAEWQVLKAHFPEKSQFIDVGCGAGYTLKKATEDLQCKGVGIDPEPGAHGVGRYSDNNHESLEIIEGSAENIPFEDQTFEVVFSSHVLEHVNDEQKSLREMKRVLKDDGILIIGMPTALMSWINLFSNLIFTTHIRIYNFIRHLFSRNVLNNFLQLLHVRSHSYPRAKTIFYDLVHYRVKSWKKIVSQEFEVLEVIEPCLYPYPDFPQWFKLRKSRLGSSSVFFICKKK